MSLCCKRAMSGDKAPHIALSQGGILYVNVKKATGLPKKPLYLGGALPIIGSSHSRVKVRPTAWRFICRCNIDWQHITLKLNTTKPVPSHPKHKLNPTPSPTSNPDFGPRTWPQPRPFAESKRLRRPQSLHRKDTNRTWVDTRTVNPASYGANPKKLPVVDDVHSVECGGCHDALFW